MASCTGNDVRVNVLANFPAPALKAAVAPDVAASPAKAEPGDENYCQRFEDGEQPHRCARGFCKCGGTWHEKEKLPKAPPGKEWKEGPGEVFEQPPVAEVAAPKKIANAKRPAKKVVKAKAKAKAPAKKASKAKVVKAKAKAPAKKAPKSKAAKKKK
jgi:hypothetical protein